MHVNVCAPVNGGQRCTLGISTVAFYLIYLSISFLFLIVRVHAGGWGVLVPQLRSEDNVHGVSSPLPPLHGFQGLNPGHQACAATTFVRWPSLPPCILRKKGGGRRGSGKVRGEREEEEREGKGEGKRSGKEREVR